MKKKKITPEDKAARLSMELARYVIPVCQRSIIDYTIDDISLLRLFHASLMPNFSQEARYLIAKMIFAYAQKDPEILRELDLPLSRQAPDYQYDSAVVAQFAEGQDEVLGGNVAQLLDISHTSSRSPSELLADFARVALGATAVSLPDEQILQRLLNPIFNPYLRDTYDVGMHDPLTASLKQINVQFLIKISYIIDQQRQRHRTISGITPTLEALYSGKPDFIIPSVIAQESSIVDFYAETMETIYAYVSAIWDTETDQSEYDVDISIYALYHLSITGLDELFRQLNENPEDVSHWINVSLFGSFFGYDHEGKPVYFNEHISDVALSTLPVHQAFQLLGYAQQTILPEFKHERTLAKAKAQDSAPSRPFLT